MAILYKYSHFLLKSEDAVFDRIFTPGVDTPHSGIYRCEGCGREVTSVADHPLPPQNHHQHDASQGAIRWRLAVWG
jgi:hypothetical protein